MTVKVFLRAVSLRNTRLTTAKAVEGAIWRPRTPDSNSGKRFSSQFPEANPSAFADRGARGPAVRRTSPLNFQRNEIRVSMISISTHGRSHVLCLFLAIMVTGLWRPLNAQKASSDLNEARSAMAAGIAAANSGNLDQARLAFERAVKLAPNVSATHAALGSVLLSQNQMTAALQELTRAHALDPGDVSINLNLARAEAETGGFVEAASLFRAALAGSPPPVLSEDESLAYAKALAGTGDLTSADTTLRNALTTSPESPRLNDALGTLLAQGDQLDQALPFFRHAIADDPTFARAQYHLGAALVASGQPQDALAPLEAAATATPNSFDIELQLGLALSALHKDTEALSHLRHAGELRASTTPAAPIYSLALA